MRLSSSGFRGPRTAIAALAVALAVLHGAAQDRPAWIMTIGWDANDEPVASYRVHVGTRSGEYREVFDAGTQTTFTYEGAVLGRRYYFAVSAHGEDGRSSPLSDEISAFAGIEPSEFPRPDDDVGSAGVVRGASAAGAATSVQASCGEAPACFAVRPVVSGLRPVSALSAAADGALLVVEDGQDLGVLSPGAAAPSRVLRAAAETRLTGAIEGVSDGDDRYVFVGVTRASPGRVRAFSIVRYRWRHGRFWEGTAVVANLSVTGDADPRLAVDRAGRIYVAMPGDGATRSDAYASRILRFAADGLVPPGNRAASPILAEGFSRPAALAIAGRQLWLAGSRDGRDHALATVDLDGAPSPAWPLALQPFTHRASDDSRGPGTLFASLDDARRLQVSGASNTVMRHVELNAGAAQLISEAVTTDGRGRLFVAARWPAGTSSIVELVSRQD